MKKIFTLLIGMVVGLGASAQDFDSGGLTYSVLSQEEKTCAVTGYVESPEYTLEIPEMVNYEGEDYTVTEINSWALRGQTFYTLELPSTITRIYDSAFYNCYRLQSLRIPDSVTEIGNLAFAYCGSLTRLELGSSVQYIGRDCFWDCPIACMFAYGDIPAQIDLGFTNAINSNPLVAVEEELVPVYQAAWEGANVVPNIPVQTLYFNSDYFMVAPGSTLQLSWTVDPEDAPIKFSSSDTDIVMVDSNGLITADNLRGGYGATITATSLNGMTATCNVYTESLEEFDYDDYIFAVIPNTENEVAVMGYGVATSHLTFPETVEHNGNIYSVTTIGPGRFTWNSLVEEITIPASIKLIRENNFLYYENLKKVTIADSEATLQLSNYNFTDNRNLTEVYVGRNLTYSGTCFTWVDNLNTIVLGSEVTMLPERIFQGCGQLAVVESKNPVPPVIGEYAFGWNNPKILVPAESVEAYKNAWEQYASGVTVAVDAENLSFETEEITIYNGQSLKLPVVVEPADAVVTFTSSNPYLLPVNKDGYVTYYMWDGSVGESIITATTLNGLTAECKVIAKHWLTFSENNITMLPGETYQVEVTKPEELADYPINWSTDNSEVAIVNENGLITAVAGGDTRIIANVYIPEFDQDMSYFIEVGVRSYPTAVIAEEPVLSVWQGYEHSINLIYEPQDDEYLNREMTWTVADPEIVEISSYGTNYTVRALQAGTTTITGETPNGVTVDIEVVVKAEVRDFIFSSDVTYVGPGETKKLEFTTVPEVTNQTFRYTSDNEEVATIDEDGVITGVNVGSTRVNIWYDTPWGSTYSWSHIVEVCNMPTGVRLDPSHINMYVNQTQQLNVEFTSETGDDFNKDIVWSDYNTDIIRITANNTWDPELGIESKTYEITGLAEGTTYFKGTTANGLIVEGDVTVMPLMAPESVTLENSEINLVFRQEEKLNVVITPNIEGINKEIIWSVDNEEVASIATRSSWNEETQQEENEYVVVSAGLGTTTITGEAANGETVTGTVTVEGIDIWYETKDAQRMNIAVGQEAQLVIESSSDEILSTLSFRSYDENVMTVTPEGLVTGIAPGENWIDANYMVNGNGYYDDIWVVVHPASGTIALNTTQTYLRAGYSLDLTVLFPMDEYYEITWETSDPDVATAYSSWESNRGYVYYAGPGTATITAKASNGATATCEVTCIDMKLNKTDVIMGLEQTRQLEVLGLPEDLEVNIEWGTYNYDVASIDETGKLTAEGLGSTYIYAYVRDANDKWIGDLSAYVDVIENFKYVESIILNETAIEAKEGTSVQLEATIDPADASDQQLAWSSSDESVAVVDQYGLVTVVGEGSAVITVSATDGSGISTNCYVSGLSGINGIFADGEPADVYDLNGILVKKDASASDFNQLVPGIYIVRRGDVSVKMVRR